MAELRDGVGERDAYVSELAARGLDLAGVVANFWDCPSILSNDDNSAFLAALDRQLDICVALGTDLLRLEITDPPQVMSLARLRPRL